MKKIMITLKSGILMGVLALASTSAFAWWGGDYYRPWYGGGPWYGGYPGYGWGGYPGYGWGGYPYHGGWGSPYGGWGYPYRGYGWGYPGYGWGYPYAVTPVQPQAETAAAK